MFQRFDHRAGHYLLIVAVAALLFLPNLGTPSLWDIDEGNNAEAAREMMERGDWVVPTFNFQLRVDKPALLYWLQIAAYQVFGLGETAARLPSVLAGLATLLLTYELGRRLFGATAGLLAALMLGSTSLFCASAHFANPDTLLNAFTVLTFLCFWRDYRRGGRLWFVPAGISAGLAVLAKGPVGLVLPAAVIGLFLLWSRQMQRLWDRRLLLGALAFALIALPWYAWVGAETKGEFLRGFLWTHNVGRYRGPMENHSGQLYYYAVALVLGFAPWSAFLGFAAWYGARGCPAEDDREVSAARRFLWCWIGVYVVFFSLAGTKLPNYILPIYPPLALLLAQFFDRWQRGIIQPPAWSWHVGLACLALAGAGTGLMLALVGGAVEVPSLHLRTLPELRAWCILGSVPLAGAAAGWWWLRRQQRAWVVFSLAASSVLFCAILASWGSTAVDASKAPRPLAQVLQAAQAEREIRVGCYQYFQPSLVFYCRREVACFTEEEKALEFLRYPLPVYLFVPDSVWEGLESKVRGPHRVLGRHQDLYRGCEIVLVTNR